MSSPNLDDPRMFTKRAGVPILDTHTRQGREVDETRLRLVCTNSNARAAAGDPALLLIGHTTENGKETDQPPLAGFVKNYQMSQWQGRPTILADLFYRKDRPEAFDYPRRSVEVCYSDRVPANNFIDAVALLVRQPERNLGLVHHRGNFVIERYSMAESTASAEIGITEADAPGVAAYMRRAGITDIAAGIRSFLSAKRNGNVPAMEFEKEDMPKLEKYQKAKGIKDYGDALERYMTEKKAGTLRI